MKRSKNLFLVLSIFSQLHAISEAFDPSCRLFASPSCLSSERLMKMRRRIDPWNDDRSIPILMKEPDESSKPNPNTIKIDEEVGKSTYEPINTVAASWISTPQWAVVLLNFVAILWGTQHAVIKSVVTDDSTSPAAFTLCRFALAALVALPAGLSEWWSTSSLPSKPSIATLLSDNENNNEDDYDELKDITSPAGDGTTLIRWGAEMGTWMFVGFALQAIGLETTTAQKSGFLLYLNVKLVPFFAWLGYRRRISTSTWISAFVAVVGTGLMGGLIQISGEETAALTDAQKWNVGDLWSIAAAAASAMFILRLESASRALPNNAAALSAVSLLVVTALSVTWTSWTTSDAKALDLEQLYNVFSHHVWEFLYLGGITTAVANWIQTSAQRYVSAERASLIYAMDPVYGAAFSYVWLGEALPGTAGWIGAGMIAAAAASNAWLEWDKTKLSLDASSHKSAPSE